MEKQHKKLPFCMLLALTFCSCFQITANAVNSEISSISSVFDGEFNQNKEEQTNSIIVTSSSTKNKEGKDNYNTVVGSSISENKSEEKEPKQKREVELLNEELEIENLNNLIVNNGEENLFIYESEDEDSEKLGILMPNAVGDAKDVREFESELDRFIAGDAEWLFIDSKNISGYIKNESLLRSENAVNKLNELYNTKAKITEEKVYIRREESQEADSITFLRKGAYVKVNTEKLEFEINEEGKKLLPEWIPVIVDEEDGYIYSDSITLVNSVDYAMKYIKDEPNSYTRGDRVVVKSDEEGLHNVIEYAMQFLGNQYLWGGTSLTQGCDCSGFVMSVYENFGIKLPHYSYDLQYVGKPVEYSNIKIGDIVVYDGHVGLYAGDEKIINALNKKYGITLTDVNYDTILAIRRVLE